MLSKGLKNMLGAAKNIKVHNFKGLCTFGLKKKTQVLLAEKDAHKEYFCTGL